MRSGDTARAPAQHSTGKDSKPKVPKQLIERIKEATNATDEVIIHTLEECNYDPNEATTRLIESEHFARQLLVDVFCVFGGAYPRLLACCRPVHGVHDEGEKKTAGKIQLVHKQWLTFPSTGADSLLSFRREQLTQPRTTKAAFLR